MVVLAQSMTPTELRARAFGLYEAFRPKTSAGVADRRDAGELDTERIRLRPRDHGTRHSWDTYPTHQARGRASGSTLLRRRGRTRCT